MSRVVVVTTSYPRGAGDADGHFVATEARTLALAHEVTVVAPHASSRALAGPPVVALAGGDAFGAPGVVARLREDPRRVLGAARFFGSLAARVRALEPDRLVVHWPFPTALALGALPGRVPTTLVSHGACVRALVAVPKALRAACVERLLAGETRWRFVSAELRDTLAAALPRALQAHLLARSFVEPAALDLPPRSVLGAPWPRPAHVIVGRLVASKRVADAITYVSRTPHIQRMDLVVIGDGPERPRLEAQARALGVRAHFTGMLPREEALGILAHSAGLLFASRSEGLSSVCREAEHYGVPVVTVP